MHANEKVHNCHSSPSPSFTHALCQLSLQSDRATFMKHSKYTREQEVTLEEEISYKSAWYVGH